MNALLKPFGAPLTMTSREIAELVGKEHFHVMRDIRRLQEQLDSMFGGSIQNWVHPQNGQSYEEFVLDKDTCLTLLLGYDAVARMKVVKRWQQLEGRATLIPQTMSEALRLAAALSEEKDAAEAALAIAAPKALALDRFEASEEAITVTQAAKLLGIKRATLTNWMHANAWVYRQNGTWVAYDQHIKNGRLQYKEARYTDAKTGQVCFSAYCHIMPKGLAALAKHFAVAEENEGSKLP